MRSAFLILIAAGAAIIPALMTLPVEAKDDRVFWDDLVVPVLAVDKKKYCVFPDELPAGVGKTVKYYYLFSAWKRSKSSGFEGMAGLMYTRWPEHLLEMKQSPAYTTPTIRYRNEGKHTLCIPPDSVAPPEVREIVPPRTSPGKIEFTSFGDLPGRGDEPSRKDWLIDFTAMLGEQPGRFRVGAFEDATAEEIKSGKTKRSRFFFWYARGTREQEEHRADQGTFHLYYYVVPEREPRNEFAESVIKVEETTVRRLGAEMWRFPPYWRLFVSPGTQAPPIYRQEPKVPEGTAAPPSIKFIVPPRDVPAGVRKTD